MSIKFGLQLRRVSPLSPPLPFAFKDDDDDDNVGEEIARHAAKKYSLAKAALEAAEGNSAHEYDAWCDTRLTTQNSAAGPTELKPSRYIKALKQKAKDRERERGIIRQKKMLKERRNDDHLFPDKEKFVTGGYKRQLEDIAEWEEKERLCRIREEKEDVTKKNDFRSDFYFGLSKNLAFGARLEEEPAKSLKQEVKVSAVASSEAKVAVKDTDYAQERNKPEGALADLNQSVQEHRRSEEAVAAARERFLARKRKREELQCDGI